MAVGISNAYYPDTRAVHENFEKLTVQLAMDAVSNVMKEFWPDVKRRLSRWHQAATPTTQFRSLLLRRQLELPAMIQPRRRLAIDEIE